MAATTSFGISGSSLICFPSARNLCLPNACYEATLCSEIATNAIPLHSKTSGSHATRAILRQQYPSSYRRQIHPSSRTLDDIDWHITCQLVSKTQSGPAEAYKARRFRNVLS